MKTNNLNKARIILPSLRSYCVISQQLIEMFIQLRIKLQKTINEAASRLSMTSKVLARIDELQAK
jgi:hypothetical protein